MQVATRRTRTAGKVEIPNVDDHVSKLEHMGKETVKKLQDIRVSAIQSGIDITVPDNRIDKGSTLLSYSECIPQTHCALQLRFIFVQEACTVNLFVSFSYGMFWGVPCCR